MPEHHGRGVVWSWGAGALATCWGTLAVAAGDDLGMNLPFNNDWQTGAPWADVTKLFRTWGDPNQPWIENPSLQLDANKYPLQPAGAISSLASYPDGVYKLSYQGAATVTFTGMGTVTNVVRSGNTTTADVIIDHAKSSALMMKVTGLDAANPLADMHMMVPGARPGQVFTDEFVRRLRPFSTIRFMDWSMTNGSGQREWSDRVTPQSFVQTGEGGVALEYQVALSNQLGRDAWVNVPVQASDDYVRKMAQAIRSQLAPGRKVYVEYSNELWNGHFEQYAQNLSNARANPALSATDDFGRAAQQEAFRTKQIGDIFRQEFGADAARVKVVLAGQAASNYFLPTAMQYLQTTYGSARQYVDAIAIAPYVNVPSTADTAGLTVDGLFQAMNAELDTNVTRWIQNNAALAARYGVAMTAYEGGQALVPMINGVLTNEAVKTQAQGDRRMGDLITKLSDIWEANGGGLFGEYTFVARNSNAGYWGALTALSDPGSPRWDAMVRMAVPVGDVDLNGSVDTSDLRILTSHYGQSGMWWEQGDITGDGRVNGDDLTILDLALTRRQVIGIGGEIVPEPGTGALVVGGVIAAGLCGRRRRRRTP